jgi:hypothetical protein
LSNANIL